VAIHPFQDGNGRVSRVLASTFLLRAASIPLFIFNDERLGYYDALEASDRGDHQTFVDFIARVALDTLGDARGIAEMRPLARLSSSERNATPVVVLAAHRVNALLTVVALRAIASVERDSTIGLFREDYVPDSPDVDLHGRRLMRTITERIFVGSKRLIFGSLWFQIYAEDLPSNGLPIAISVNGRPPELFLRLDEVEPKITSRVQRRITAFVDRVVAETVAEAQRAIDAAGG
jgi:hypothetical protein